MNAGGTQHELHEMRTEWKWFFGLGVTLIVLGVVALGHCYLATVASVVVVGLLMLVGGVAQIVNAFWAGKWSGFMLHMLIGILYVVAGAFLIDDHNEAMKLTLLSLLMAAMFIVGGVFKIVVAMSTRFSNWGWALLSGIVSLLLGILIYKNLPELAPYVIGLYVGIELLFNGWYWVMLGVELKGRCERKEDAGHSPV